MEKQETPLQRFVRMALEQLPKARDHYDKQIQRMAGTSGKPLYDLSRDKGLNPRTPMLKHMAAALGQPFELIRQAADGHDVLPIAERSEAPVPLEDGDLGELADRLGLALVDEIDLSLGMGATFLNPDQAPDRKGLVPFRASWLRDMFRGPLTALKVVRGSGDSMQPTIHDGDFVLIDTSRRSIDEQDVVWAVSYGELGMIRRLRQLPNGGVLMMPDNPVVRPAEAYDGEMHVMGRVIWIGRRM